MGEDVSDDEVVLVGGGGCRVWDDVDGGVDVVLF